MTNKFLKVENVKVPLKKGDYYLVPCIVNERHKMIFITPILNHPHNDVENGQPETHYHVDYRFVKHDNKGNFPIVKNKHSKHQFVEDIRPRVGKGDLVYFVLPVINEEFKGVTPVEFILKSNLKHHCIHKGKCPHRGFDLSQVNPVNGIIKCPLHGLEFDANTGELVNFLNTCPLPS
jgi:hypothetical protein